MKTARAVIYTRVSTGTQAERGTGLPEQLTACQKKAEQIGAEVVAIHTDPGVSGALYLARPSLQAALRDLEECRADTLIIYNLSRCSRDREHQAAIKKRVEAAGARLVFTDMTFEETPAGEFAFNVIGDYYHFDRQAIRQRTMNGKNLRAESGVMPCPTMRPWGYYVVSKDDVPAGRYPADQIGKYQVIEEEATYVREMFARYAGGASLRAIARWLHSEGVPTPRTGRGWLPTTVRSILTNPAYKGTAAWGKHSRKTDEGRMDRGLRTIVYRKAVPEDQWVYIPCPALVDAALWEQCQSRQSENRSILGGNRKRRYMLSGLLRCPNCGRSMNGKTNQKHYRYYVCRDYCPSCNVAGRVCNGTMYPASAFDAAALRGLTRAADCAESIEAAIADTREKEAGADGARRRELIDAELQSLESREAATAKAQVAAIEAGRSTMIYDRLLGEIDARRRELRGELDGLGTVERKVPRRPARTEAQIIADQFAKLQRVLSSPNVSDADKHDLMSGVIGKVTIRGTGQIVLHSRPFAHGGETVQTISMFWPGYSAAR